MPGRGDPPHSRLDPRVPATGRIYSWRMHGPGRPARPPPPLPLQDADAIVLVPVVPLGPPVIQRLVDQAVDKLHARPVMELRLEALAEGLDRRLVGHTSHMRWSARAVCG
jgi:hypothetical protein